MASISKQFAAFSVALLAADGKLSLDDEVRKHLPEIPDFGKRITVRHLMHHTSGLRDQWTLQNYAGWREDDLITEADVLQMAARQRGLNFDPGAEYLYSNTGFTLLGAIVKRVVGTVVARVRRARIFAPLGMSRTHFHNDHTMIVRGAPRRTSRARRAGSASASRSSTPTAPPACSPRLAICCAGNRTSSRPGSADARWSTRRRCRAG